MEKEILVCKGLDYAKISAIKDIKSEWGKEELDEKKFSIVTLDLTDEQVFAWDTANALCLNDAEKPEKLIETPAKYQIARVLDNVILLGDKTATMMASTVGKSKAVYLQGIQDTMQAEAVVKQAKIDKAKADTAAMGKG